MWDKGRSRGEGGIRVDEREVRWVYEDEDFRKGNKEGEGPKAGVTCFYFFY